MNHNYIKFKIQDYIAYCGIIFLYFLTIIYGTERIARIGKKIINKYEDKN